MSSIEKNPLEACVEAFKGPYPKDTSRALRGAITAFEKIEMICGIALFAIGCCVLFGKIDGVVAGWYTAGLLVPSMIAGILKLFVNSNQQRALGVIKVVVNAALATIGLLAAHAVVSSTVLGWCIVGPGAIGLAMGCCCLAVGCCALSCLGIAKVAAESSDDSKAETNSMSNQSAGQQAARQQAARYQAALRNGTQNDASRWYFTGQAPRAGQYS